MAKIGIFGGTFNPIHKGHLFAIETFYKALSLDLLLVIPAAIPPHKQLPEGSPNAALRLKLVQAATAHLPYVQVSDIELQRQGKSYTAQTLAQLHARYPEDSLYLLLGTDSYLAIQDWYEPERICALATLVCMRRGPGKDAELLAQKQKLQTELNAQSVLLDSPYLELSSTTVRRMLAFGSAESYVPQDAYALICKEGLYATGEDLRNLDFDTLCKKSLALHKPKRVRHVIGCSQTAAELAARYGANTQDAARAGILHDITKALDGPEQLCLCQHFKLSLHGTDENGKLLHARTGAAVAEHIFGENAAICSAIRWHTTGKADMTTLEKIIYIADYMEPNRDFDGVERLRELVWKDLDAALLCGFEMTLESLRKRGKVISEESLAAREYLLAERTKKNETVW